MTALTHHTCHATSSKYYLHAHTIATCDMRWGTLGQMSEYCTTADTCEEDLFNMSTSVSATVDTILQSCTQKQHLSCFWCWWRVIHCKSRLQRRFAPHPSGLGWAGLGWAGLGRNVNLPQHTTHDAQPGPCMTRTRRENKCNPKLQIFFILLDIFSGPSLSLCARCGASLS